MRINSQKHTLATTMQIQNNLGSFIKEPGIVGLEEWMVMTVTNKKTETEDRFRILNVTATSRITVSEDNAFKE